MILNWSTPKHGNISFAQRGAYRVYVGSIADVTLEDLLECCETNYAVLLEILRVLKRQGFRKERISRQQIMDQGNQILIEIRNMKRQMKSGGYNA